MKLRDIAARLDCELAGDGEIEITGVAGMEHAGPGELTFLANPKYAHKVRHTRAGAILVSEPERDVSGPPGLARLVSAQSVSRFRARAGAFLPAAAARARHSSAGLRRGHGHTRRRRFHRAVRRGGRARAHRAQRRAASARGRFTKARRSATIFWRIRTPWCASSAGSATA